MHYNEPMMIDTHSHLQFYAFNDDIDEVVARTRKADIRAINVGTGYATSKAAVEFAEKYGEGFFATIGLHPMYAGAEFLKIKNDPNETETFQTEDVFDVQKYRELAQSEKVVAIGEIGLDYYYKPKSATKLDQFKQKQKAVFVQQLDLAKELNLPVILHCRVAHDDVIEIIKTRGQKGVVHCFTGTLQQAKKYVELGFYLGINGIIFKFDIDQVIKTIPLEYLLLETDCPYLTPPSAPQKRNEPIFMEYTIQKIAGLKNISIQEIVQKTTENARILFNL